MPLSCRHVCHAGPSDPLQQQQCSMAAAGVSICDVGAAVAETLDLASAFFTRRGSEADAQLRGIARNLRFASTNTSSASLRMAAAAHADTTRAYAGMGTAMGTGRGNEALMSGQPCSSHSDGAASLQPWRQQAHGQEGQQQCRDADSCPSDARVSTTSSAPLPSRLQFACTAPADAADSPLQRRSSSSCNGGGAGSSCSGSSAAPEAPAGQHLPAAAGLAGRAAESAAAADGCTFSMKPTAPAQSPFSRGAVLAGHGVAHQVSALAGDSPGASEGAGARGEPMQGAGTSGAWEGQRGEGAVPHATVGAAAPPGHRAAARWAGGDDAPSGAAASGAGGGQCTPTLAATMSRLTRFHTCLVSLLRWSLLFYSALLAVLQVGARC